MRKLGQEEKDQKLKQQNSFLADVSKLKEITGQIDAYTESNNAQDLEQISNEANSIMEQMEKRQVEVDTMKPELDKLSKAVEDQEQHKKNLKDNMEIIQSSKHMDTLEKEIERLEASKSDIVGHETCQEEYDKLVEERRVLDSKKARLEGRRGEVIESIRGFKVISSHVAI